jgi:predicted amidohydrolase
MRVLMGQLEPLPGDPAANARAVADVVAAAPSADLAVFPELFLSGYAPERAGELAVRADGPELAVVAEAARHVRTAVVVGFAEQVAGGTANAVACIGATGELAAVYRKTHLFGDAEREAFVAGDALCVTELAGVRVAPLVCFDVEFPEAARAVSLAGAELLVTVAANMDPYADDHALAARARALDNRRPHVYVNRTGRESDLRFCGASAAIGADGRVITTAGDEPAILEVEIDLTPPASSDVDYLSQIRSDLEVERPHLSTIQGGTR